MTKEVNDIADFFIIIKNSYKLFLFSLIFFFFISLYFSNNQIVDERKNYILKLDLTEVLMQTHMKIENFKIMLPEEYTLEVPSNTEILELLNYGITEDLNKTSDLQLIGVSSEISNVMMKNSFSTLDEIKLVVKLNFLNDDDNKLNISSKNNLETIIKNNLNRMLLVLRNNLNSQISSIKEKILIELNKELNKIEMDLEFYKTLFISNIDTFLSINEYSSKNNENSIKNESSKKNIQ